MSLSIFTSILFITILTFSCVSIIPIDAQCLESQRNLLLQFNNTVLQFNAIEWYLNTDCCSWEGVTCSKAGHVTGLDLSYGSIYGDLNNSSSLFSLNFLRTLNLARNSLSGGIPNSMGNLTQLISLYLSGNMLSGAIPNSMGNLTQLVNLDLSENKLSGAIPNSMGNLTQLTTMDFSYNGFTGPLPSFQRLKNLADIKLSNNDLSGPIPSNYFKGLLKLDTVHLSDNSFSGRIPSSLFRLPSLFDVDLHNNKFEGQIPEILNASSSQLLWLYLSRNKLEGEIPHSFFDIKFLESFDLSYNNLNGTVNVESLQKLCSLQKLSLSYNQLIVTSDNNSIWSHLSPDLVELELASCKLQDFPGLRNLSNLFLLELSNNQIGGEIPNWIWSIGLKYLDLSHNFFENLQEPYTASFYHVQLLDLSSNNLQGEVPIPKNMSFYSFSAANNKLSGTIPQSICNFTNIQDLDFLNLSNNSLSGTIPLCLIESSYNEVDGIGLAVLDLGKNHLTGNISPTFQNNCGLEVIDLHDNHLQGKIPKSLVNCTRLKLLNLGNNRILDTFPSFLSNSTSLSVLVLRSNLLHGVIPCSGVNNSWSEIQIFDLSSNYFSGSLMPKCFLNFKAMMTFTDDLKSRPGYLYHYFDRNDSGIYNFELTVSNKDQQMELKKILTIFTVIDFSMNNLVGEIPDTIGELKMLYVLNLSHNGFTDSIPSSLGNLKQLGSLDLSANKLIGKIPTELASLTFLSVLNLSQNQLSGKIPFGGQLQTFPVSSFEGNNGLCGLPLNKSCINDTESVTPTIMDNQLQHEDWTKWEFLSGAGVGYAVGIGLIIIPLLFCKKWSELYWKYVDRLCFLIVGEKYLRRRRGYIKPL